MANNGRKKLMDKYSDYHKLNIKFSELNTDQISELAQDYLDDKEELEKSIKQINTAKLIGLGSSIVLSAALSPVTLPLVAGAMGVTAVTLDTANLAERLNEWKNRRR